MCPLGKGTLHFLLLQLRTNGRVVSHLNDCLVTFFEYLDARVRLLLALNDLHFLNELESLLSLTLLAHVFLSQLAQLLLQHQLMCLLLHVLLDLFARSFKLFHDTFSTLLSLVFLVHLSMMLHLKVRIMFVLLTLECLLHLLLHGLHLLLDLVKVAEEALLIVHPLLKPTLTQLLPLTQNVLVVLLNSLNLIRDYSFLSLCRLIKFDLDAFHGFSAGLEFGGFFELAEFDNLVTFEFVVSLAFLNHFLFFGFELSQTLSG